METRIKTWEIINDELKEIKVSMAEANRKEREHLEQWIRTNPSILGENILIIGQQVQTKSGPLDFLGLDSSGNLVVVELKRDRLSRDVLTQAIDYASDVSTWGIDKLSEICQSYVGQSLEDHVSENFEGVQLEELVINKGQRLLLVGFSIDGALSRMIEWLSSNYDIGVNALILKYIQTSSGNELLSRTAIISEEVEKEKTSRKKYKISMSDEPGNYSTEELRDLLTNYLRMDLWSANRIKNIMLPYLMRKKIVTRMELKKEFVRLDGAKDESQAGYFLSLISNQLGQKSKDYLRQVISYEYPNFDWEKDNFTIRQEYQDIVKDVLSELAEDSNRLDKEIFTFGSS